MPNYQIGVFAATKDAKAKLVLVRSRTGQRWVFPKGRPEKGRAHEEVAKDEAWEEAGLKGKIKSDPSEFKLTHGTTKKLFLYHMSVDKIHDCYPESDKRERIFVSPEEAEKLLGKDLRKALRSMSKRYL